MMALSPMSRLVSSLVKPGKRSTSGRAAWQVNQSSPRPDTLMPNSVPFRAMMVTRLEPSTPWAASVDALPAAMARLRKKWSFLSMNRMTSARSAAFLQVSTRKGAMALRKRDVPALFLLWSSSPMWSAWAIMFFTSSSCPRSTLSRIPASRTGYRTFSIQRSLSMTSGAKAPMRSTFPSPSFMVT